MKAARLVNITDSSHNDILSEILLGGGIVGSIWAHHLYFLACNALDSKAVSRMNNIKGRPSDQVFGIVGSTSEVEEFADINKCTALIFESKQMKMSPLDYLDFLAKKFPTMFEFYANDKAPSIVTFPTPKGRTVWISSFVKDKKFHNFVGLTRDLRRSGRPLILAGTSLNLSGQNTLNVKNFQKVIEDFGSKIEAISVHPNADNLKKLSYSTSCSVISFIHKKPTLVRLGNTPIKTIKKYVPDLQISDSLQSTRH